MDVGSSFDSHRLLPVRTLVILPQGEVPKPTLLTEVSARLAVAAADVSFLVAGERLQDTLSEIAAPETVLPVFWHSLSASASRMYPASDIAQAVTASGACRIIYDPQQAAIFDAAKVATRVLGAELRQDGADGLTLVDSGAPPPLASFPRLSLHKLLTATQAAVTEKRGFSFIRVNHCEPRMMGFGSLFTLRDTRLTTGRQWGRVDTTPEEIAEVAQLMRASVRRADVIGVPPFKPVIVGTTGLLERSVYCLSTEPGFLPADAAYADVTVHNRLATHPLMFELMRSAPRLVLISSRPCLELDGALHRSDIERVAVPEPQTTDSGHYPGRYREIMACIEQLPPGTLVLIGAGVLGKIYCDAVKRAGAVALDIGAVFDAWTGLNTRSSYKPEMALKHQLSGG